MHLNAWVLAIATVSAGMAALAHSGATGVVKERMDAMGETGDAMKRLAPVMRGQAAHDPDVVREAADTMIGHVGPQVTELIPEGSNGIPSEALDAIWEDRDEFAALAEALRTGAEGIKLAADNGLSGSGDMPGGGMMVTGQGAMGTGQGMTGSAPRQMT